MWFLYVPLLFYALNFALQYVDFVTAQALERGQAPEGATAAMPFAGASAATLYYPIRVAAYLGLGAWIAAHFFLPKLNTWLVGRRAASPDTGAELV